ncbi:MAG: hypothetical protein V4685_09560 [Bacteroidota bacterium]
MKKTLLLLFVITTLAFQLSGCKKEDPATPPPAVTYSIHGLWTGTYTVDGMSGLGQQELNLVIKPDGTMINDSKAGGRQHIALGTWTLVGDTAFESNATCIYGFPVSIGAEQKHTAIFNETTGNLTMGIYVNTGGTPGSGTFTLTKVD